MTDLEWLVLYYAKLRLKLDRLKRVQQPLVGVSISEAIKQAHENTDTLRMLTDFYAVHTDNVDSVVSMAILDVEKNLVNIKACIVEEFCE